MSWNLGPFCTPNLLESLQMMGERDKETKPITAGLYTNMECGKSHVTSKKENMSKMEG